jgi:hypothetical protein
MFVWRPGVIFSLEKLAISSNLQQIPTIRVLFRRAVTFDSSKRGWMVLRSLRLQLNRGWRLTLRHLPPRKNDFSRLNPFTKSTGSDDAGKELAMGTHKSDSKTDVQRAFEELLRKTEAHLKAKVPLEIRRWQTGRSSQREQQRLNDEVCSFKLAPD